MNLSFGQKIICFIISIIAINNIIPTYCIYKPSYSGLLLFALGLLGQAVIFHFKYSRIFCFDKKIFIYIILLLSLSCFQFFFNSEFLLITGIEFISIYFLLSFFLFKYEMKDQVVHYFIMLTTCLFSFSLVEYVFHLLGQDFIMAPYLERGEDSGQIYAQGIFNLYRLNVIVPRFQGLFKEPGHLGVCAGLLLYSWRKLSNYQRIVWTISGLLSLSLAFYILAFGALLFNMSKLNVKQTVLSLSIIILCGLEIYSFTSEIVDEMIIMRVEEYIEDGDNRSTADFNIELTKMFNTERYLYGYGNERFFASGYSWGNAGVKVDLYKYGCIGVLIIFIMSLLLILKNRYSSLKYKLLCIVLFCMCYYSGDIKFALYFWLILFYVGDQQTVKYNLML